MVKGNEEFRVPKKPELEEPIPPAPYDGWFVPARWMLKLAERYNDIPDAFIDEGPEYCSVIYVDSARMVHASIPVRWSDPSQQSWFCPPLAAGADPRGTKQVGSGHQHTDLSDPSEDDVNQACAATIQGTPVYQGAVADFFNGKMLAGTDPETGRPAAIPSQHFLMARQAGRMRVFMWVRLVNPPEGHKGAVALYTAADDGTDSWHYVAECWISNGTAVPGTKKSPPAKCNPSNIWQ